MPVARMKMRPWLEMMIESNKVPGLSWVDKDEKMFSITWKHAARHGWQVDKDAGLFKNWAIHTGKYREGVDDSDPKKWKANFRCAMNSLPDIEQVKCKSVNKGQQAVRVYRMVADSTNKNKRPKTKEGKRRNKSTRARTEVDFSDTQSNEDQHAPLFNDTCSTQENTVDSTVHRDMMYSSPSDCEATIEIGPDSTDDLCTKFQISPAHSPVCDEAYDIKYVNYLQIFQQLEQDKYWMQSISDGLLNNELHSDANSSPDSQWSETSSGDERELFYTVLGIDAWNVPPCPT